MQHMMVQADISDAEKFRHVLKLSNQMDYGTKLGVYQDKISVDE